MAKTLSRISALTTILILIGLSILGCSREIATDIPQTPATPSLAPATATEEFVPVIPKDAKQMVIFSYEEDGYAHLFVYIPEQLPITRITSGAWDDITPAIS